MSFVIDRKLTIDAPTSVVWEVVSDLPRYAEWNPFCIECASTLRPGDPIDMKVKLLAKPQAQREWISEFIDGERFAYCTKPMPLGALSSLRFHQVDADGTTRTRYQSYFHLRGWLRPLVLMLFRTKLEHGFAAMNAAVQTRAERLWRERSRPAAADAASA